MLVDNAPRVGESLDLFQVVVSQLHRFSAGGVDSQDLGLVGVDAESDLGGMGA